VTGTHETLMGTARTPQIPRQCIRAINLLLIRVVFTCQGNVHFIQIRFVVLVRTQGAKALGGNVCGTANFPVWMPTGIPYLFRNLNFWGSGGRL